MKVNVNRGHSESTHRLVLYSYFKRIRLTELIKNLFIDKLAKETF